MKVRTAIRKSVKWGGAVAVVLLVALWVSGRWYMVSWYPTQTSVWQIHSGTAMVKWGTTRFRDEFTHTVFLSSLDGRGDFFWWFFSFQNSTATVFAIPLWVPTVLLFVVTALAWRADRRATRLARIGHCPTCGYDRRGLAAGSVCPECGAAALAAPSEDPNRAA